MHGEYFIVKDGKVVSRVPNTITKAFETAILNQYFRNTGTPTFYLGLGICSNYSRESTMEDIVEVTGSGYSRVQIVRDSAEWGEPQSEPQCMRITSAVKTFSASGDWTEYDRIFIADAASGGNLLSMSDKFDVPVSLSNGDTQSYSYSLYFK